MLFRSRRQLLPLQLQGLLQPGHLLAIQLGLLPQGVAGLLLREKFLPGILNGLLSLRLLQLQVLDVFDLLVEHLLIVFLHLCEVLLNFPFQLKFLEVQGLGISCQLSLPGSQLLFPL